MPNKSNNEIVLVLQHFENCVDKAVQAFLEGTTPPLKVKGGLTPAHTEAPPPDTNPSELSLICSARVCT